MEGSTNIRRNSDGKRKCDLWLEVRPSQEGRHQGSGLVRDRDRVGN
jgi:hypothetical protein